MSLLIVGLGILGLLMAAHGLTKTLITGTATLRGGRKISRSRFPRLYWSNVAALCVLLQISAGLIWIGVST
jgi:hypothetical protein